MRPTLDRPKEYTVDIFASKTSITRTASKKTILTRGKGNLFIEIDGAIHFCSPHRYNKTKAKHENIEECLGIKIVHYLVDECVGKYALSDEEILTRLKQEIHWYVGTYDYS